jgi:AcrR family transcriptional regulator
LGATLTTLISPTSRIERTLATDKAARRRRELAEAAQQVLANHGYARTSLRDIAVETPFSHGLFHYYFEDKDQLVAYAVALYKEQCARRYDEVVQRAASVEDLVAGFREVLEASLRDDAPYHRLWYDLRNQSLFQSRFRDVSHDIDRLLEDMVWRILSRYAELAERTPVVDAPTAYALFDGVFLNALTSHTYGTAGAVDRLGSVGVALLPALVGLPS